MVPTQRALALRERVHTAIEEVRGVFTPEDVDYVSLQRTFTIRANDGFLGISTSDCPAEHLDAHSRYAFRSRGRISFGHCVCTRMRRVKATTGNSLFQIMKMAIFFYHGDRLL